MENEKNKTAAPVTNVDTASVDDVNEIMKKYDRESATRIWTGKPKAVISCILALFSLFCIYVTLFGSMLEQVRLTSFMGLIIVMGYLTYPISKKNVKPNSLPWYDILLMVLGAGAFFYYCFNANAILTMRMKHFLQNPLYTAIGIVGILSLAELCRRCVGVPILVVAGIFIAYVFISGTTLPRAVYELFYGDNGVLTTPVNVCSKYIAVFIVFGAFLERTGIADYFISLANSITGRFSGGPAKVAVISSALCGMVSGSSVGNTVTTGSITIPMMKKTGYRGEFAGAVEAAASTGGQIMPPIMGAAAFLMADYLGVAYSDILVRAILPAVLYFMGIFIAVHLEAKKLGLKGIPKEMLPRMKQLIRDSYLLLPLIVLIYLVCSNSHTMQFSAAIAILTAITVGYVSNILRYFTAKQKGESKESTVKAILNPSDGFSLEKILESLAAGGRGCITVAVACGIAGIVCGCLTVTGLASTVINAIVTVAGSYKFIALVLTMLCCIVLGMGLPTTATYCIMASTCAPILIQIGIPAIAAHFFVFYFGIVADITPPVALAAYAGAAIAKGSPMKTGITATRLAIAAFIIPFAFCYAPSILFIDAVWYDVLLNVLTATIGVAGVAAGLSGYLFANMNLIVRGMIIAGGLCMVAPGLLTDVIGLALLVLACVIQFMARKNAAAKA